MTAIQRTEIDALASRMLNAELSRSPDEQRAFEIKQEAESAALEMELQALESEIDDDIEFNRRQEEEAADLQYARKREETRRSEYRYWRAS